MNSSPVKLTEWDFVADGGAIVIVDEVMNKCVSGVPVFLSVKKAPSGRAITTLIWATDKKQYTLVAEDDGGVRGAKKPNLFVTNMNRWINCERLISGVLAPSDMPYHHDILIPS